MTGSISPHASPPVTLGHGTVLLRTQDLRPFRFTPATQCTGPMVTWESAPHYFSWGWIQISLANLIVLAAMLLVFLVAVMLRMPEHRRDPRSEERGHDDD